MNRKGGENLSNKTIFLAFMLIMVSVIVMGIFRFVGNAMDDTTYWKNYYSKDLGLIADVSQAGRGELIIYYDTERAEKKLVFDLKKENIALYDDHPKATQEQATKFRYANDETIKIEETTIKSTFFKLIFLKEKFKATPQTTNEIICPTLNTKKDKKSVTILIDSNNQTVKNFFEQAFNREGYTINNNARNPDLVLIINNDENSNKISFEKIPNSNKAEKLICLITKEIDKTNNYIDDDQKEITSNHKDYNKIQKGDLGIIINKKFKNNNEVIEFTNTIINGVNEYHG